MKALLMHQNRDFELRQLPYPPWKQRDRHAELQQMPLHERSLIEDLELNTLLRAMTGGDEFLFDVAQQALLSGPQNDLETILYRHEIVKDSLKNPAVVRGLYALAVETIEASRKHYISTFMTMPGSVLYGAMNALQMLIGMLRKLRDIAVEHAGPFESRGFTVLFAMLQEEFSDAYFARMENHLRDLEFRRGALMSAQLGKGNEGVNYVLRQSPKAPSWFERLFDKGPAMYTYYVHQRDEAGLRILSELRGRGINQVANVLAQSAEHILSFFEMLRTELAFYVGCLNLHDRLAQLDIRTCFPDPQPAGTRRQRCVGLCDVCLALQMGKSVVSNSIDAHAKNLIIITGANQGGKSTFLRSVGLAQLMMQAGMFVAAEFLTAELCSGLFTHYKREEDPSMKHGKLDEELARMSELVDQIGPNAMMLCNESFASTNEREGSEIARQVVLALREKRIKIFLVTHLYDFAHSLFERGMEDALFLRAERDADGRRTFRVLPGEPLETSYGEDLYREIFAAA